MFTDQTYLEELLGELEEAEENLRDLRKKIERLEPRTATEKVYKRQAQELLSSAALATEEARTWLND